VIKSLATAAGFVQKWKGVLNFHHLKKFVKSFFKKSRTAKDFQ